ncbi:MAG: DUF763 domain-containing protein [Candidatus Woesearchaeota archaeon]|nr:MAG: DUF763 domain-containing protein [Candidatus Woesearchaeota archaeon]
MKLKTGIANLPLHSGKAPKWLFKRMVKLARNINEIIILEHGKDDLLKKLSDPYWFQAYACVLGFDFHSSGCTTVTMGALKEAMNPEEHGIFVTGGKGKFSRKTPEEIEKIGEEFSLNDKKIEKLRHASIITAKVDNCLLQDNYNLYHHSFVFDKKGRWITIQQGMSKNNWARRYHWLSDDVRSFVEEPHSGICCDYKHENTLDMTSKKSRETRKTSLDLIRDNPSHLRKYFLPEKQATLNLFTDAKEKILNLPSRHDIKFSERINFQTLQRAYEIQPENYENLLSVKGVGPATVRALALISELVYGAEPSWQDPVRYSFAHGGKDGIPYPVNKKRYDRSIMTLRDAIEQAKIGRKEKINALRRLNA